MSQDKEYLVPRDQSHYSLQSFPISLAVQLLREELEEAIQKRVKFFDYRIESGSTSIVSLSSAFLTVEEERILRGDNFITRKSKERVVKLTAVIGTADLNPIFKELDKELLLVSALCRLYCIRFNGRTDWYVHFLKFRVTKENGEMTTSQDHYYEDGWVVEKGGKGKRPMLKNKTRENLCREMIRCQYAAYSILSKNLPPTW